MNARLGMGCAAWLVLAGLLWPAAGRSEPAHDGLDGIFRAANQAYLDGQYEQAIGGYGKLIEAGIVQPDVYYNLANAHYRAGHLGLAVLFYEKALELEPNDEAAASNLAMVRKELIDRVVMGPGEAVGEPPWHEFLRGLGLGWLSWTFLALYLGFFALASARRLMGDGPWRRLLFWLSIPVLSVCLVFGGLLAGRIYVQERVHHAVVISPTAPLREGPERTAKVLMEVHEGLKVQLVGALADHVRVRLANGVEGFLLESQIGRIRG